MHSRHNVQVGHEARPEPYSKVRSFTGVLSAAETESSTSRWKITGLPLVPSMIHQLVNSPEWAQADTSSIETTGSGAAFLPPELQTKFQSKVKSTFLQGYGSSEAVRVHLISSAILGTFTQ